MSRIQKIPTGRTRPQVKRRKTNNLLVRPILSERGKTGIAIQGKMKTPAELKENWERYIHLFNRNTVYTNHDALLESINATKTETPKKTQTKQQRRKKKKKNNEKNKKKEKKKKKTK